MDFRGFVGAGKKGLKISSKNPCRNPSKNSYKNPTLFGKLSVENLYTKIKIHAVLARSGLCSEPLKLKDSQTVPSIGPGHDELILWGKNPYLSFCAGAVLISWKKF